MSVTPPWKKEPEKLSLEQIKKENHSIININIPATSTFVIFLKDD